MNTPTPKHRLILAGVFALALTLTLGPALPAGAAPAADDTPAFTVPTWLTDGLSFLGSVAGQLGLVDSDEDPDADDGPADDAPVVLDDDGGEALRPERIGYGLTAVE